MKNIVAFLLVINSVFICAQKEYAFASTGQQKLIINPSLTASLKGLEVQTLFAFTPDDRIKSHYEGVSYGGNKFSFGLSRTRYSNYYGNSYTGYVSTQLDLSASYKISLGKKLVIVPSIQLSIFKNN